MESNFYYRQGYAAFCDGKNISECPYDYSDFNDNSSEWARGWFDARSEHL